MNINKIKKDIEDLKKHNSKSKISKIPVDLFPILKAKRNGKPIDPEIEEALDELENSPIVMNILKKMDGKREELNDY